MAITGAVGAALRQEAPYQAEIQMGAQLIMDFQGARSGRRPYYWYRGTRYTQPEKIPGWSFSRASAGCAEDSAGNLIAFPANEPRITDKGLLIEEARTNKVAIFNANPTSLAGLTKSGDAAATLALADDSAALAAAGLAGIATSGQVFKLDNSAGTSNAFVLIAGNSNTSVMHVVSAWVRYQGPGQATIGINVNAGTFATYPASEGYVRRTSTPAIPTTVNQAFVLAPAGGVLYFILPQLEEGAFATSPIITTGVAATRAADSVSISGLGAIIGQFRTNLVPYSTPTAGQWTTTSVGVGSLPVVTYGAAVGPNGTQAARVQLALNGGATGGDQSNFYSPAAAYTNGVTATASVWLRSNTGSTYAVALATPNGQQAVVNVTPAWQRFTVSHTPAATGSGGVAVRLRGAAGTSDSADILVADAQWELGGVATDLIVSAGAPASAGSPFSVAAWANLPAIDGVARTLVTLDDGSVNNRVRLSRNASNQGQFAATVAGVGQASLTANGYAGALLLKMASRVKAASYSGAVNGAALSTAITAPPGLNRLRFGVDADGVSNSLHGYLARIVLGDVDDSQVARLAA